MDAKVYSVSKVYFHINKSNPPQLVVNAHGQVNSSCWSNGRLIPWMYVNKPADGVQDYDFVATAPHGKVLWLVSPIAGDGAVMLEDWMKGIRVHASSNKSEVMLDDASASVESRTISTIGIPQPSTLSMEGGGGEVPVPFFTFRSGPRSEIGITETVGYSNEMSFNEAFQDALKNLPPDSGGYPDQLKSYTVTSISAEFGGFAGFHRLRVAIRGAGGML